jgi:exodeoxyribonuclease VII large subunit
VVSGVGHETDFTIADFAADRRAPTPTAAAELVSPDRATMLHKVQQTMQRLNRQISFGLQNRMQRLDTLAHRLIHPGERIEQRKTALGHLQMRLQNTMSQQLILRQTHLHRLSQNLEHLAPQQVLNRGYSMVQNEAGAVIHSQSQLQPGEQVNITFAQGGAGAKVTQLKP